MITIKSHSGVTNPEERLRPCKAIDFRMTKIDTRRFSVTTTSKSYDHYQSDADRPFPKDRWDEHLTIGRNFGITPSFLRHLRILVSNFR